MYTGPVFTYKYITGCVLEYIFALSLDDERELELWWWNPYWEGLSIYQTANNLWDLSEDKNEWRVHKALSKIYTDYNL